MDDFSLLEKNSFKELKDSSVGSSVLVYRQVDSTNEHAKRLLIEGEIGKGTVIVADEQLMGKGRLGRVWQSPPGVGLWMTVVLEPKIPAGKFVWINFLTAVVLAEIMEEVLQKSVELKWPNDVLIGRKKVSGILLETVTVSQRLFLMVGIGINVNQESFPAEIHEKATSLLLEGKVRLNRAELFLQIVRKLGTRLDDLDDRIISTWKNYAKFLGNKVRVFQSDRVIEGIAVDIDKHGALILDSAGQRTPIYAGDVQVSLL